MRAFSSFYAIRMELKRVILAGSVDVTYVTKCTPQPLKIFGWPWLALITIAQNIQNHTILYYVKMAGHRRTNFCTHMPVDKEQSPAFIQIVTVRDFNFKGQTFKYKFMREMCSSLCRHDGLYQSPLSC